MDQLITAIKQRRTIHQFKTDKIAPDIIEEMLDLMRYIPNHGLIQSWKIYCIGDHTKKKLLDIATKEFTRKNLENTLNKIAKWERIPHWFMVTQAIEDKSDKVLSDEAASINAGLYAMQLFLYTKGIGTKWVTGSIIYHPEWMEACTIDSNKEKVVALLWAGYPEKIPNIIERQKAENYVKVLG